MVNKRGKLIIFSAPSGSGKTTIVNYILEEFNDICFSVSATSRKKRDEEINGKHYYFLSKEEFEKKIKNDEFLEWEEVYKGSYYGTLKSELNKKLDEGKNIIFDVDVKGALNIKKEYPENSILIFIEPPSLDVLEERLRLRNTESESKVKTRIERARLEMGYKDKFDITLVNDNLNKSKEEANKIVANFIMKNEKKID